MATAQTAVTPWTPTFVQRFRQYRPAWLQAALGSALIAVAVIRIVCTYPVFNQTYDEPISIACGMEWLEHGTYRYDVKHPPLGRVVSAIPAYLAGGRLAGQDPAAGAAAENADFIGQGNALLTRGGHYWRNLAMARAAILPFFLLACGVVWAWTAWAAGRVTGLIALGLFTWIPPVLGHAGLAMTDVPLMATLAAALFALCLWLERPSVGRSAVLGAFAGLAILSKLTALAFLPLCGAPIVLVYALRNRGAAGVSGLPPRVRIRQAALAICAAGLIVWGGYRFSWQSYEQANGVEGKPHVELDQAVGGSGLVHRSLEFAMRLPIPAPEFFGGIRQLWRHNLTADYNYFLGERSNHGWKYYYPVIVAVKTPVPLLILAVIGAAVIFGGSWRLWTLLLPVAGILAAGLLSHVNIGVRHILVIYVVLAGMAAVGALRLLRLSAVFRGLAAALLLWTAVVSALAHPDYLAWFNEFADGQSGKFGVESDLDYGQDLARLASECARLRIPSLALTYHGTADAALFHLPPWHALRPGLAETGWVAISMCKLKVGEAEDPHAYSWLEPLKPVALAGKSIRVYFVPAARPRG